MSKVITRGPGVRPDSLILAEGNLRSLLATVGASREVIVMSGALARGLNIEQRRELNSTRTNIDRAEAKETLTSLFRGARLVLE